MKYLIFMTSLFYRWYNNQKSSKEIAYESAIMVMGLFICINIVTLILFLGLWNSFSLGFENLTHMQLWGKIALLGLFVYVLLAILVTKKKILALNIEKRDQETDYILLISYCVVSMILFIVAINLPR